MKSSGARGEKKRRRAMLLNVCSTYFDNGRKLVSFLRALQMAN